VWLESTVINQLDQVGAVVAVSHDVSARRQQEAALRASEQELRTLAESVPTAVFRVGAGGSITYANTLWYELTEPCGPVADLAQLAPPEDRPAVRARLDDLVAGAPASTELDVATADGRTLRLRCRSLPAPAGVVVMGTVDDVTADVALAAELRTKAERDELTGLANRAGLERLAAEALARGGHDTVVVFVDLDGFKAVNDTWGHEAGDAVLAAVADRLRSVVRPGDVVGRYGGDEFVLLCSEVGPGAEAGIVERIDASLVEPIGTGAGAWAPAASIGVVRPRAGESVASALRRADAEMYERKRHRRAG
jgi:diguanylate cyclase (GGDEF)-like protein/PAS domain S-box-containing protein